jgi:hypothetical protein
MEAEDVEGLVDKMQEAVTQETTLKVLVGIGAVVTVLAYEGEDGAKSTLAGKVQMSLRRQGLHELLPAELTSRLSELTAA